MEELLSALYYELTDEELMEEEEACIRRTEREMEIEKEMMERLPKDLQILFCEYMKIKLGENASLNRREYIRGFNDGLQRMADAMAEPEWYSG